MNDRFSLKFRRPAIRSIRSRITFAGVVCLLWQLPLGAGAQPDNPLPESAPSIEPASPPAAGEQPAEGSPSSSEGAEARAAGRSLSSEPTLSEIVDQLGQGAALEARLEAIAAAGRMGYPELVAPLRWMLRHEQAVLRRAACEALTRYRLPSLVPDFAALRADTDRATALCGIAALGELISAEARTALLTIALDKELSGERRRTAIEALSKMPLSGATSALSLVADALGDELGRSARDALAKRRKGCQACAANDKMLVLLDLLAIDDVGKRTSAVQRISDALGPEESAAYLQTAFEDPNEAVRLAAVGVVAALPLKNALELLVIATEPSQMRAVREQALGRLAEMEAAEALELLVTRFGDPGDPLRLSIARLLRNHSSPLAQQSLVDSLSQRDGAAEVRLLGLATLVASAPADLVARLQALSSDEADPAVADALRNELVRLGAIIEVEPPVNGRNLFVTGAALHGGASLLTMSLVAGGGQPWIAGLAGSVLGGGGAYLLTLDDYVPMGQAAYFTSIGPWGAMAGYGIAGLVEPDGGGVAPWLTLGGWVGGATLGLLTYEDVEWLGGDVGFIDLSLVLGTLATTGAQFAFEPADVSDRGRYPAIAMLGGLGAGLLPAALLSKRLSFSGNDPALVLYATGVGAFAGGFATPLFAPDGATLERSRVFGGVALGQGLGYLGGVIAAQGSDLSRGELAWLLACSASGTVGGVGLGLLIDGESESTQWLAGDAGLLLATGIGALSVSHFELSSDDVDLALVGSLVGAVAGNNLPTALAAKGERAAESQRRGFSYLLGAAGFSAGLVVEQLQPTPVRDSILTLAGTTLGGATGAGLVMLQRKPDDRYVMLAAELAGTAGLVSGFVAAPHLDLAPGNVALISGAGLWGAWHGAWLADLWSNEATSEQHQGGAMLGAASSMLGATWVSQRLQPQPADALEGYLFSAVGAAFGGGVGLALPDGSVDPRIDTAILELAGIGGLVAGLYVAPETEYRTQDKLLMAYGALAGGWAGAWMPVLAVENIENASPQFTDNVLGGLLIGSSLGTVGAATLGHRFDMENADVLEVGLGSVAANLFGAGIGLMIPVDNNDDLRPMVGAMEASGLLGTIGVALAAPHTDFSAGDRTLGLLATLYGGWQGVGTSMLFDGSDRQVAGAVLATAALGGIGGAWVSQHTDLTTNETVMAFIGSLWGSWIGGMGSYALRTEHGIDLDDTQLLGTFVVGSDVGLVLSAVALSPLADFSAARVGWVNLAGLAGMAFGTALPAIFRGVPMWTSNVIGSSIGLAAGAVVTGWVELPGMGSEPEAPPAAEPDVDPTDAGARALSRSGSNDHGIDMVLPQVVVRPLDPNRAPGGQGQEVLFSLTGLWR